MSGLRTRRCVVALVGILAALLLPGCAASRAISVGAVVSLTSPAGPQPDGEAVRNGIQLAIDELNARGGVNGRKLELVVEDAATDPVKAAAAFERIEKDHHPLLYVSTLSSPTLALAPLAARAQAVLFGLMTSSPTLTQQNEWTYRLWPTVSTYVSAFVPFLTKLNVKRLGILSLNDDFGRPLAQLLATTFAAAGGEVRNESFEGTATDYRDAISRLANQDAIVAVAQIPQMARILEQVRASGYKGIVLGNSPIADPSVVKLPQTQGAYSVVPLLYNPAYVFADPLRKAYSARYGKELSVSAAVGYDLIKLVSDLLEDQEVSRASLKSRLERGFVHAGVFGDLRLAPGQRDLELPLFPVRIVDGAVQYQ